MIHAELLDEHTRHALQHGMTISQRRGIEVAVAVGVIAVAGLAVELADLAPRFGLTPITDAEMAAVESGGGSEVDAW